MECQWDSNKGREEVEIGNALDKPKWAKRSESRGGVKARENAKGYTTLLPSEKEMGIGAVVIKLTFFRHF